MSSVCVLTPMIVGSWPIIAQAVVGAATTLGFTIAQHHHDSVEGALNQTESVETMLANSEVVAESMGKQKSMTIVKDGMQIKFQVDDRGRCSVCASGKGIDRRRLKAAADEVAGRITQQFAYHKLMSELKQRKFRVVSESMAADHSIHMQVQLER